MWIFLSVFNIICAYFAEKYFQKNKYICFFSLFLIVLSNTIVLGLRDFGVGTDTMVYIDTYFNYALSITNFQMFFDNSNFDYGFLLLAYLSTFFGNDSQNLLILTELFIILFIVLGLYKFKSVVKYSMTWFMILFVLRYQNTTVNLMRQFCAMSLLFYGYSLFLHKKIWSYLLIQIISYFFHSSAIVFIVVPFFYYFAHKDSYLKYIYALGVFGAILFFIIFYYAFLSFIGSTGILKEIYMDRYGAGSRYEEELNMGLTYIPSLILPVFVFFIIKQNRLMVEELFYMLIVLYVTMCLLEQLRLVMTYFYRIGYYIGLVVIIYMSNIFKYAKQEIVLLNSAYIVLLLKKAYSSYGYDTDLDINMVYSSHILGIY